MAHTQTAKADKAIIEPKATHVDALGKTASKVAPEGRVVVATVGGTELSAIINEVV